MADDNAGQDRLAWCVSSVEGILKYNFRNTKLLEDALTLDSFPATTSFQRLEFLGDSALNLAVANFAYLTYPNCAPGQHSFLRELNVKTEKLARVAVRNGFHRFVRHGDAGFTARVQVFVAASMEEDEMLLRSAVRAPKILADIVESIAGAVYIDCGFDLKAFWLVFRGLLEPLVTLETLQEYERPMTTLTDFCWAQGKMVETKFRMVDSEYFAHIYVDGELVATANSMLKESARLSAARKALRNLAHVNVYGGGTCGFASEVDERNKVEVAKRKLSEICAKRKWPQPSYRVEKEEQSNVRKYVCSVHVEVEEAVLVMHGDEQSTVKDAENSAASFMICSLLATEGHAERHPIMGALEAVKRLPCNDL